MLITAGAALSRIIEFRRGGVLRRRSFASDILNYLGCFVGVMRSSRGGKNPTLSVGDIPPRGAWHIEKKPTWVGDIRGRMTVFFV